MTTLAIFCDGACRGNGRAGAKGGWAWAAWRAGAVEGSPVATGSARLLLGPAGEVATNQRAELMALLEALRWLAATKNNGTIYTDSQYAINCTSKWGAGWRRKGWKRDSGEPLQNLDLIQPLVALWRPAWALVHVAGHQTGNSWQAYGNNWVDKAAVVAAEDTGVTVRPAVVVAEVIEHVAEPSSVVDWYVADKKPVLEPAVRRSVGKQTDIRLWFSSTK